MFKWTLSSFALTQLPHQSHFYHQQFVLAAPGSGHGFMGRLMMSQSNRFYILHIQFLLYLVFHIRRSYIFYFLTSHTYQQIHWSDCQYQRPGSCNRHTRSRWISPFLVEEERKSSSNGYQDNLTNTFGIKLTTLPPFIESTLQNLVGLKGTRSLFWLKVHILVKYVREIKSEEYSKGR